LLTACLPIAFAANIAQAQTLEPLPRAIADVAASPKLQKLSVPAVQASGLATKLSLRYRDVPGVQIAPDPRNEQLVVMAPELAQRQIARDVQMLLSSSVQTTSSQVPGPLRIRLANISWQQFEGSLQAIAGTALPVTTSRNGLRASFQLTAAPLQGTTVEVDRAGSSVTVVAPQPSLPGWQKLIAALDHTPSRRGEVTELMRIENADPAPIQRMLRLLRELEQDPSAVAMPINNDSPFRNAVFQAPGADAQDTNPQDAGEAPEGADDDGGSGVIGDTQIQFVPELGQIIIRGAKRDVARVMDVIKEIELKSKLTQPEIQVISLKHTDANAVATLLTQLYDDVLSARQGEVSITSLDSPNALLLIGRKEAVGSLLDLISKIDQPIEEASKLRVFRLQNASAVDAQTTIQEFFSNRPQLDDELRPGIGPRVRVLGDFRTNSLIVSAAPRDMAEVTRLINELDVLDSPNQQQLKVFPLANASAEDLATTLQDAITGEGENPPDNVTLPSTALSIIKVEGGQPVKSGILSNVTITADTGANSIVVRAPAGSLPLIAELIRQLDKAPNIDSLVKVFTIENGDAAQLTLALETLFGSEAATTGTQVGGANLGELPSATAGAESSLVPLRFSNDIRTNAIIASGSAEDLEVVESILLRLDSEGFAERITEVIWLRHNDAPLIAQAITDYVNARRQSQTNIQQYQQGLGPYDLLDRDVIAIPEVNSNSILLSVSPRLYEDVRHLIDRLDRRRPMVLIKVMIAEVLLDDFFEIGGEVGLQDSLVYNRGIAVPDGQIPGTGAAADPGFNFNNAGVTNLNRFAQESLAATGVTTFGVGTASTARGYGGFVLNAANESISLLFRTLQQANRLQILSRPQVMTMENTEAIVRVGRKIARVTGVVNTSVGGFQTETADIDVGLILQVRPRVGSDGLITMDVNATRSDRDPDQGTLIPTGAIDGSTVLIQDIRETTAQSVLTAYSGQTVVFGGLIQKTRANSSRRVPIVADIPLLGHLFKFDAEEESRSELLVVMTPLLITGDEDLDYVKEVESSRMSWCLADVIEMHGDVGLSGGYGLWGPAVGPTIYPDLQPTVQREVVISDEPITTTMGAQPPVVSDAVNNPATPAAGGQAIPAPPITAPPITAPPITAPVDPLPGTVVPGRAGAANQPMPSPALEFPTLPESQMLPATPVSADVPEAGSAGDRVTTNGAISPSVNRIPSYASTPEDKPVAWLDAVTNKPVTKQVKADRPMPKRLGGQ
jgi:type II secretory pathway component GspD/PulD (secretin)